MPELYSIQQFAAKIRERRPDLGHIPDATLVGKTLYAAPDLKRYLSQEVQPFESPRYEGGASNRTAGQVASDQAENVLKGGVEAITGIPSMVGSLARTVGKGLTGDASGVLKDVTNLARGGAHAIADPFVPVIEAAAGYNPLPEDPKWSQAAKGAGAQLSSMVVPEIVAPIATKTASAVASRVTPVIKGAATKTASKLRTSAAENKARALAPVDLESQAAAQRIAPELAQNRQAKGIRGKTIDRNINADLARTGRAVDVAENRLSGRTQNFLDRADIIDELDETINNLYVGDATGHPEAVASLTKMRSEILKLPEKISFDDSIKFRRQLDKAIEDKGGWKQSTNSADRIDMITRRGVSDMFRSRLNKLDPLLRKANHDYWLARKGADIVARRQLGEVGKIGSNLPGRGSLLDDILASSTGAAVAGPAGAAVAEVANLARQTRGWSNVKSRAAQGAADILDPIPPPEPMRFVDDLPRHPVTGEILMPPSIPDPAIMQQSVADRLRAGQPVDYPVVADDLSRNPITGELLLPPSQVRHVTDTIVEYNGKLYGERAPLSDPTPRHPITGEILMPTSAPTMAGNDLVYQGRTYNQIRLTEKQLAAARKIWEQGGRKLKPGQMDLFEKGETGGGALAPPDLFSIQVPKPR